MNNELHVVLGASGGIGSALTRELVTRGKRVRAVNRSGRADVPAGVETIKGDVLDAASMRAACQAAAVVYHCANVPYPEWHAKLSSMMNTIIEGAASANAKLIVADNLYMYGPVSVPMTEALPYNAAGRKGKLRAQIANTLMEAHARGKVRTSIGRASDFYEPGVLRSLAGEDVFRAVIAGKQAMWVCNLDAPRTMTFVTDFARGLATLGERDEALGEIWHIPGAEPITGRQFLQIAFEAAGKPAKIGAYSRAMITLVGLFSPIVREVKENLYQYESPFVVDGSTFARVFGSSSCTPHRDAIKRTVEWHREHWRAK